MEDVEAFEAEFRGSEDEAKELKEYYQEFEAGVSAACAPLPLGLTHIFRHSRATWASCSAT